MFRRFWENRIDLHGELKQQANAVLEEDGRRMAEATLWHALLRNHQLSDPEGCRLQKRCSLALKKKFQNVLRRIKLH